MIEDFDESKVRLTKELLTVKQTLYVVCLYILHLCQDYRSVKSNEEHNFTNDTPTLCYM